MQESNIVIISLHPQHANKLLSGEKKLEFRRIWASKPVSTVLIYSTAPVKKIVAIAHVQQVHLGSPTKLWSLAKAKGGGLSRRALYSYFKDKKQGYAIEFSSIKPCNPPIDPRPLFDDFHPPQSFAYIDPKQLKKIEQSLTKNFSESGKTLFIAGVHGVGKSSMCEEFSKKYGAVHKTASQLIRLAEKDAISKDTKAVKNIARNQELLVNAVSQIRKSGDHLLLDGHFVLQNAEKQLTALPTKVFSELLIDAVIALHDEPKLIKTRINGRDGTSTTTKEITEFQSLELIRAEEVSKELGIPFVKVKSFNQNDFEITLNDLLASKILLMNHRDN